MIKFFRKIRQRLLTENKFSKYLIYAIGEIVLVVIGILIALSINNLNEQNKAASQEKKLLIELINNLDSNIASIEATNRLNTEALRGIDIIIDHFQNSRDNDSLRIFLLQASYTESLNLSFATFETIKIIGFDIIKNDQVRLSIIELFEVNYPHQIKTIDEVSMALFQPYANWVVYNRHKIDEILMSSELKKDEGYVFIANFLEGKKIWKTNLIKGNERILEKTIITKILIENYLKRKANIGKN